MPDYHGWTHAPKEQGGTDPIPNTGTAPGIWGYINNIEGITQTVGNTDQAGAWSEAWLSADAISGGWITTPAINNQCSLTIAEKDDGALWVVETRMQVFFDTTPSAGDWVMLGNLMAAGASLNVEDIDHFWPAEQVSARANDATVTVVASRIIPATQSGRVVTAEYGNFCSVSGTDILINQLEIMAWRVAPGQGTQSFP